MKDQPLNKIRDTADKLFGKGDYVGAKHYNRLPDYQQPAEVAHAWGLDFLLWNAVKYLSRAGHKATATMSANEKEIDDLSKAVDYIKMRINVLEGRTPLDFDEFSMDKPTEPTGFYSEAISMREVENEEIANKRTPSEEEVKTYYRNLSSLEADERPKQHWMDEPIESFKKRWNIDTIVSKPKLDMRECYGDC